MTKVYINDEMAVVILVVVVGVSISNPKTYILIFIDRIHKANEILKGDIGRKTVVVEDCIVVAFLVGDRILAILRKRMVLVKTADIHR